MPETFPVLNRRTGVLEDTEHLTIQEVAARLHVSESWARKTAVEDHWPHMTLGKRSWFSTEDLATIVAGLRRNDVVVPEADESSIPLGLSVPPDPWLIPDSPADQDPGGVR